MSGIRTARDSERDVVIALLRENALPTDDFTTSVIELLVDEQDGHVAGAIGLERFGEYALLRSLVVSSALRGTGRGVRLVAALEQYAARFGVTTLVLLTETASDFFQARGYAVTPRDTVPAVIRECAEFRSLCPSTAVCLVKWLG